jgi:hypothetical protein
MGAPSHRVFINAEIGSEKAGFMDFNASSFSTKTRKSAALYVATGVMLNAFSKVA